MGLPADLLIRVPIKYFKAFCDLVLVVFRGAVTHVVENLIANLGFGIFCKLKESLPELLIILPHSTGTHLLSSFKPDKGVLTPGEL